MSAEPVIQIPVVFRPLLTERRRYRVLWGGRGSGKSHTIARVLLIMGMERTLRVVCAREIMTSIADSVHRLLTDLINEYGLNKFYTVQKDQIFGANGTTFLFKGLKHNISGIKSLEGADICWVEEAENVSDSSWEVLVPTIRKEGSEIWISFNTRYVADPTYERYVRYDDPDIWCQKVSWRDNPFFPLELEKERIRLLNSDLAAYNHVWEGEPDTRRTGFIYAREISKAREDGRITTVRYDPGFPVYTGWDIGFGDSCSIWWFQIVGREVRWIDHYSNAGEYLPFYVEQALNTKPYGYARTSVYLPHDGAHDNFRGERPSKQFLQLGYPNVVLPRDTSVWSGIELTRQVLAYSVFDSVKCAAGIKSLENYRQAWDEDKQVFRQNPVHDWASNDADAARTVAKAVSQLRHIPIGDRAGRPDPYRTAQRRTSSWMAS